MGLWGGVSKGLHADCCHGDRNSAWISSNYEAGVSNKTDAREKINDQKVDFPVMWINSSHPAQLLIMRSCNDSRWVNYRSGIKPAEMMIVMFLLSLGVTH